MWCSFTCVEGDRIGTEGRLEGRMGIGFSPGSREESGLTNREDAHWGKGGKVSGKCIRSA